MNPLAISRLRWACLVFIPLAFLHFFVFIQHPISIFLEDGALQASQLPDMVLVLLVIGLISLLVLFLLIALLGWPARRILACLLLSVALSYWLIDSFFSRQYPALDGAMTELPLDAWHGWIQLGVLLAVITLLWLGRRTFYTPVMAFLAALTVLNGFWAVQSLLQIPTEERVGETPTTTASFYQLSRQHNVLLVLMDTFQSEYLEEVLAERPGFGGQLQGFHYFPDTLGVATSTFMSIPAIHSGRAYEPVRTMSAYFEESIRQESILSSLGQAGYEAVLLNPIRNVCPEHARCLKRDLLLRSESESNLSGALNLLDISLLRSAPEPWKNRVLNEGRFLVSPLFSPVRLDGDAQVVRDDSNILSQYAAQMQAVDGPPQVRFLHLMNTHPPYVLGEDCEVQSAEDHDRGNRASALQQSTCAISQLVEVVQALQQAGIYEQTMIVVMGDHGSSSAYADASLVSRRLQADEAIPEFAPRLVGSANPLLMIKPFSASGPLEHSSRRADLTDIPATICAALPVCDWQVGVDLFAAEAPAPRQRRFMNYRWEHRFWEMGSIPELEFYTVAGPISAWSSWQLEAGLQRKTLLQMQFTDADDPTLFSAGWGNLEISAQGNGVRWVVGHQAELLLPLSQDDGAESIYQLNLGIWVPDFNPGQAVSLELNGHAYPGQRLEPGMHTVKFRIPVGQMRPGTNRFLLKFDAAQKPNELDHRLLAVVVNAVNLEKIEFGK